MQDTVKNSHEPKNEIMETVQEIHKAEDEAKSILAQADNSVGLLIKKSKEESIHIISKAEIEATELKNNLIKEMESKIGSELDQLLQDAKKEALNIKKKEFDKKMLMQLARQTLLK